MLRCVLRCFEVVSGLHLNLVKSSLIAIGVVSNSDQLAADLGCHMDYLPSTYLGMPLGATYKQKRSLGPGSRAYEEVVGRLESSLSIQRR